jgi:hypothetical protein
LDLILPNADLSSKAVEFDHPAFFPIALYRDAPAVFENENVLGGDRRYPAEEKGRNPREESLDLTHKHQTEYTMPYFPKANRAAGGR